MTIARTCAAVLAALALASGCGDDGGTDTAAPAPSTSVSPTEPAPEPSSEAPSAPAPGSGRDPACEQDEVNVALCDFVEAVLAGDVSSLTAEEQEVATGVTDLPAAPWTLASCDLVGDVTVECQVVFAPAGEQEQVATFALTPSNGEYNDGSITVPPGETLEYGVVEYLGVL